MKDDKISPYYNIIENNDDNSNSSNSASLYIKSGKMKQIEGMIFEIDEI